MMKHLVTLSAILLVVGFQSICYAVDGNSPNLAPIANAGPDQTVYAWIDGLANVELDGSDSNDPEGGVLNYHWTWSIDSQTFDANGPNPEIQLPVGTHVITLVVTDNANNVSAPDEVVITVVAPLEVQMKFTPQALNLSSKGKWVKAQMKLPEGFKGTDVDTAVTATIEPFGLPSHHIHVSHGKSRKVQVVFDRSTLSRALGGITEDTTEITVVGQLKTGQFFFGTDTIKLIKKLPKHPKAPKNKMK